MVSLCEEVNLYILPSCEMLNSYTLIGLFGEEISRYQAVVPVFFCDRNFYETYFSNILAVTDANLK